MTHAKHKREPKHGAKEQLREALRKVPAEFATKLRAAVQQYAPELLTDEHAHGHDLGDHRHDAIPPSSPHKGER